MITLQLPPTAAKQAQPTSPAPANAANPAAPDADPAIATKAQSLFAFLLAQQTTAAVPGTGKAVTTIDATEKRETTDDGKAGDPAAASPWMWLNTALPREAACAHPKSAAPAGPGKGFEGALTGAAPAATLPGAAAAQAPTVTPEAAAAQSTGVGHKSAADELSLLATTLEGPAQNHGAEIPTALVQAHPANQAAAPAPNAAPVEVPIESKVGTPRWTRDIHQSVTMLVQARASVAELRLTPADMGPIQIRIDFSEKQPSVSISVQQADTRNALDAALPRLRDMMAESGITLGGAGVEQHGRPGDAPGDQARFAWHGREQSAPLPVATAEPLPAPARTLTLDQLVDTYA